MAYDSYQRYLQQQQEQDQVLAKGADIAQKRDASKQQFEQQQKILNQEQAFEGAKTQYLQGQENYRFNQAQYQQDQQFTQQHVLRQQEEQWKEQYQQEGLDADKHVERVKEYGELQKRNQEIMQRIDGQDLLFPPDAQQDFKKFGIRNRSIAQNKNLTPEQRAQATIDNERDKTEFLEALEFNPAAKRTPQERFQRSLVADDHGTNYQLDKKTGTYKPINPKQLNAEADVHRQNEKVDLQFQKSMMDSMAVEEEGFRAKDITESKTTPGSLWGTNTTETKRKPTDEEVQNHINEWTANRIRHHIALKQVLSAAEQPQQPGQPSGSGTSSSQPEPSQTLPQQGQVTATVPLHNMNAQQMAEALAQRGMPATVSSGAHVHDPGVLSQQLQQALPGAQVTRSGNIITINPGHGGSQQQQPQQSAADWRQGPPPVPQQQQLSLMPKAIHDQAMKARPESMDDAPVVGDDATYGKLPHGTWFVNPQGKAFYKP